MFGYFKYSDKVITILANTSIKPEWTIYNKYSATYITDSFTVIFITSIYDGKNHYKCGKYKAKKHYNEIIEVVTRYDQAFHQNFIEEKQYNTIKKKFTGLHTSWYKNGRMKCNVYIKNGKFDGQYLEYDENGNLTVQANYCDNDCYKITSV
jgi:antitoxin component YwqK of YwqJK toxin-antitoxin module